VHRSKKLEAVRSSQPSLSSTFVQKHRLHML